MRTFDVVKKQKPEDFLREVGISLNNFNHLLDKTIEYRKKEKKKNPLRWRGQKSSISLEDKLMLTLIYFRQYPTFDQLGKQFGISESYANKIYHEIANILVTVIKFTNRKELNDKDLEAVIIDVTEQPIERPKKKQKAYYSGKKKRHTIKVQLVVCFLTLRILSVFCSKGSVHDFKILKKSKLVFHQFTKKLADSGYQGIAKIYANSEIPIKKKKNKELTPEEKAYNGQLSKKRIFVENVNRRCKILKISKETYRGKHKNYGKTWNIVSGLVNLRYAC